MSVQTTKRFEAEIRDTQTHLSTDDPSGDADYTVNLDELHPNDRLDAFESITVYVDDTHNNPVDTTVQSVAAGDTDYSAPVAAGTANGSDRLTLDGPVGRVQLSLTASTAPTAGRVRVTIHAVGPE